VRNQRCKALQGFHQLKSGGYGLGRGAYPPGGARWGTPGPGVASGREALVKVYGVARAMPEGIAGRLLPRTVSSERGNHLGLFLGPSLPGACRG
jgi:hypothetical protein